MSKRPTIRKIAELAGVSPSTASQVLNNKGTFKESTRAKVEAAALQLGLHFDAARSQKKVMRRLGIVFPPYLRSGLSENKLYQEIYGALTQRIPDDVSILVAHNDVELFPLASALTHGDLSAVVAFGAGQDHPTFARLTEKGIPTLAILRQFVGSQVSWVSIDHRKAAYDATKHLAQLGHQRIAFVSRFDDTGYLEQRVNGFYDALADSGIGRDRGTVVHDTTDNALIDAVMNLHSVTAVFASPDPLAAKIIAAAKSKGLRVPEDLAVVGFDNLEIAAKSSPGITTVGYSRELLAQTVIDMLQIVLEKGLVSIGATIPHQLVIRESCGSQKRQPR